MPPARIGQRRRKIATAPLTVVTAVFFLPIMMIWLGGEWHLPCKIEAKAKSGSFVAKVMRTVIPTAQACGGGGTGGGGGGGGCLLTNLSAMDDPLAQQMESGSTLIWDNTHQNLQSDFNSLRTAVRASAQGRDAVAMSAYRPFQYQRHLWEIADRWCTGMLNDPNSTNSQRCPALRTTVSAEKTKHFPTQDCPLVVATPSQCASHTRGIAVDISLQNITSAQADQLAQNNNLSLRWANITNDPVHWQLTRNIPACP